MKNDFTFMVVSAEPFTTLGVSKIEIPIPVAIASAVIKSVVSGNEVPLDLPTLRDFVMVCCRKHPELADRCKPVKCCLAFLLGRQAMGASTRMLAAAAEFSEDRFIEEYSCRVEHAMALMMMACELSDQWTDAPILLKHNSHWDMARLYMLAHMEEEAVSELEKVIEICGSYDLVPDVWLALAGILFSRQQTLRARALLDDYVHRATTLFPERTREYIQQGCTGEMAQHYSEVRDYFENLTGGDAS